MKNLNTRSIKQSPSPGDSSAKPSVTLISISYQSAEVIITCLQETFSEPEFRSLVIDNGSSPSCVSELREQLPNTDIISLERNLGYGRAANIGLEKTTTPYAILVNPDIILDPLTVRELVSRANSFPKAAILAPATHPKHAQAEGSPRKVREISGSCMFFNLDNLGLVGSFDPKLFLFSEETDLCLRTISAGFEIVLFPDLYVEHLRGKSSGTSNAINYLKNWHFGWSRSYYYEKHGLDTGKRSLKRRLFRYQFRSLTARAPKRKLKYRATVDGIRAFCRGEPAFGNNDIPRMQPGLGENPFDE